MKEVLEKRKQYLLDERDKAYANVNMLNGAILQIDWTIQELEKPPLAPAELVHAPQVPQA
jgi:hypothetical protein